jgi:hypothetical protein
MHGDVGDRAMPIPISVQSGGQAQINEHPDECPICHSKIIPRMLYVHGRDNAGVNIEVVYSCPNSKCNQLFIAYFFRGTDVHDLRGALPFEPTPVTLPKVIQDISPAFCEIYGQAHKAEQFGINQISGIGYRKALEFLIKDYLIGKRPDDKDAIEAKPLGTCIKDYVEDPKVKQVTERATWLGNDETHYKRRWPDKDLSDLKRLIGLVLHWLEMEHLTEEALNSMPAKADAVGS